MRWVVKTYSRLRSEYLFNSQTCSLVTADIGVDREIVAYVFVCIFPFLNDDLPTLYIFIFVY